MHRNVVLLHGDGGTLRVFESMRYQLVTEQLIHLLQGLAFGFCKGGVSSYPWGSLVSGLMCNVPG